MSKLLKRVAKGVKKVFRAIKKVVKKIVKSKIFKVLLVAAAVYFTAGAAAGMLGSGGAAAATGGVTTSVSAASAATATVSSTASIGTKILALAKQPLVASSILTTGGTLIAGAAKNKAEQEAYDKRSDELDANNKYQLVGLKDRLAQTTNSYTRVTEQDPNAGQVRGTGAYYDSSSDTYKSVGASSLATEGSS